MKTKPKRELSFWRVFLVLALLNGAHKQGVFAEANYSIGMLGLEEPLFFLSAAKERMCVDFRPSLVESLQSSKFLTVERKLHLVYDFDSSELASFRVAFLKSAGLEV